jgi:predicted nucleic acid-binding protein
MSVYDDTSFLVAIYLTEADSAKALRHMQRLTEPLPFTPFHRHELRTGIRFRAFRRDITTEQCMSVFREIEGDLTDNILTHTPIPWTDVFRNAESIAEKHSGTLGVRSLDLLHVALAVTLGTSDFVTFDTRQSSLAKAVGLKVKF